MYDKVVEIKGRNQFFAKGHEEIGKVKRQVKKKNPIKVDSVKVYKICQTEL